MTEGLFQAALADGSEHDVEHPPREVLAVADDDPQQPERQSLSDRAVGHDSLGIAWAAGAFSNVPGAHHLVGLALLVELDPPIATDVVAIVGFNLVMVALITGLADLS